MTKDVIYIDVEDDIAAIIDKLKQSSDKIIAFVPPKGNAVLQSVVNLKLLKRAAEHADKQPVIVTSNHALTALAGGLGFYISKNLQSKPVLMNGEPEEFQEDEAVELSDGEVVDGAGAAAVAAASTDLDELASLQSDDEENGDIPPVDGDDTPKKQKKQKKAKDKADKKKKIPNFDSFRKKLLIGGGILLLVIIVLLLIFGRTKAKIALRAETTPVDVAFDLRLNADAEQSNPEAFVIKASIQESKKTLTQDITPTGEKDLGTKATGKVSLQNCSRSDDSVTIPGGTGVSANNLTFLTAKTVVLPASIGRCHGSE